MSIKVLLADDHQIVREGLRALLEREQDIRVVGEAANGHETARLVAKLSPDVVVMDISMPLLNGVEATRQVVKDHPQIKVVMLSRYVDRRYVSAALEAGASGYVLKNNAAADLVRAVRVARQNQTFLSPAIAQPVVSGFVGRTSTEARSAYTELTGREREVLQLIAEGKSSKEIAAILHLSVKTVETHRSKLMQKLKLHNVAELTKYAVREGIATLGD